MVHCNQEIKEKSKTQKPMIDRSSYMKGCHEGTGSLDEGICGLSES